MKFVVTDQVPRKHSDIRNPSGWLRRSASRRRPVTVLIQQPLPAPIFPIAPPPVSKQPIGWLVFDDDPFVDVVVIVIVVVVSSGHRHRLLSCFLLLRAGRRSHSSSDPMNQYHTLLRFKSNEIMFINTFLYVIYSSKSK